MRDLHLLASTKQMIVTIEDATIRIRKIYPKATKEGSICSYHWIVDNIIVGEAWLHRNGKCWWLRIK